MITGIVTQEMVNEACQKSAERLKNIASQYSKTIFSSDNLWELRIECKLGFGYFLNYAWKEPSKNSYSTHEELFLCDNYTVGQETCGLEIIGWKSPGILLLKPYGDWNKYTFPDEIEEIEFNCITQIFNPPLYD